MSTDTTFFTNEPGATLLDRFKKTLQTTRYFDVLVGYFRTSGFHRLYDALEDIEKIRVLVGLSIDRKTYEIIEETRSSGQFDFESHESTRGCKRIHNTEVNHYAFVMITTIMALVIITKSLKSRLGER